MSISTSSNHLPSPPLSPAKPSAPLAQRENSRPVSQYSNIQELQALAKVHGTSDHQKALENENSDSIDAALKLADDAALEEGIRRSLQDYAFHHFSSLDSDTSTTLDPNRTENSQPSSSNLNGKQKASDNSQPLRAEQKDRDDKIQQEHGPVQRELLNERVETYLAENNFKKVKNPCIGDNCLIYSLVQAVLPRDSLEKLDAAVQSVRTLHDKEFPVEAGKMLRFVNAGPTLISLINKKFEVNIQARAIYGNPPDLKEKVGVDDIYSGEPSSITDITHNVVIWDKNGHFELVTARPDFPSEARRLA